MITQPHHASGNRADAHMRARGLPDRYFLLFVQRSSTQGLISTQSAVKFYTKTAVRRKQERKGHKDLISEPLAQPCCELPLHCRCLARWLHALSGNLIWDPVRVILSPKRTPPTARDFRLHAGFVLASPDKAPLCKAMQFLSHRMPHTKRSLTY